MRNEPSFDTFQIPQLPASACPVQSDQPLPFPTITLDGVSPSEDTNKQDVWEYLIANINDFEVAKTIVDFVDANPKLLTDRKVPVDLLGLHVLAKVTLKRQAVAYAKELAARQMAQQAVTKAREESRSLKSFARHFVAVARALRDNPQTLATMVCVAALVVSIFSR